MKPVIGTVILLVLLASGLMKGLGIEETPWSSGDTAMHLLGFPFGYYEGSFGAGNGILTFTGTRQSLFQSLDANPPGKDGNDILGVLDRVGRVAVHQQEIGDLALLDGSESDILVKDFLEHPCRC